MRARAIPWKAGFLAACLGLVSGLGPVEAQEAEISPVLTAVAENSARLRSLQYEFEVTGGPALEFESLRGRYTFRNGEVLLTSEVRYGKGDVRYHAVKEEEGGVYRSWNGTDPLSSGFGRIGRAAPESFTGAYLPIHFGQRIFARDEMSRFLSGSQVSFCRNGLTEEPGWVCLIARGGDSASPAPAFRIWLDPAAAHAVRRIEMDAPRESAAALLGKAAPEGVKALPDLPAVEESYFPYMVWEVDELAAVSGVRVPVRGTLSFPWRSEGGSYSFRVKPESVRVEPDGGGPLSFPWPLGAAIVDETRAPIGGRAPAQYEAVSERYLVDRFVATADADTGFRPEPGRAWGDRVVESACGASSVFAALTKLGAPVSLEEAFAFIYRDHSHPGSFLAIADFAERQGVGAEGLRTRYEDLPALATPFIVHLSFAEEGTHFIVVWQATPERILASDLPNLPRWSDRKAFEAIWTGNVLTFKKSDQSAASGLPAARPRPRAAGEADKEREP